MTALLLCLLLGIGQLNSLQSKPVVHLLPNSPYIHAAFGGKTVDLINAPPSISLPAVVPAQDLQGNPWAVDVKNLGPAVVTVVGNRGFKVQIAVGATVHIYSNDGTYIRKW